MFEMKRVDMVVLLSGPIACMSQALLRAPRRTIPRAVDR